MAGLHLFAVSALHLLQRGLRAHAQQVAGLPLAAGADRLETFTLLFALRILVVPCILRILRLFPLLIRLLPRLKSILQGEEVPILDDKVKSDLGEQIQFPLVHHTIPRIHTLEEMGKQFQTLRIRPTFGPHKFKAHT